MIRAPGPVPAAQTPMDLFTRLFRDTSVSWWDVIDILIVAVVIYEFLKLIRGTRAAQMAVGSLLIALLFFASRLAPLQTVNWVVRNVIGYLVFAAIVIFQSDIRRALAHFGRMPFVNLLSRAEHVDAEVLEEVVVAATMMSDRLTGAIIVLERDIGLRNYIESGIPLDATVTYDLLVSIFLPASPLHDGAAILQEDRIAAAACFLPLTVNPQLSRELGTRHRAAIGLTEETDAVAVIVSEETGLISLAVDGGVERGLDGERLRTRLRMLTASQRRTGRRREGFRGAE
jgi:diadenylate cyclase